VHVQQSGGGDGIFDGRRRYAQHARAHSRSSPRFTCSFAISGLEL
jgi:hypothetical protein